jgi:hypothetical protein
LGHAVLAVEHHGGLWVAVDQLLEQRLTQHTLGTADHRRQLLVVTDQNEPRCPVGRQKRPRRGQLGCLVYDRDIERLAL